MSVKAMSLVWELPCPSMVNNVEFKPGHKYVLLAYADHADQFGKNIYPAVFTVHRKTGYDERSIQRLTRELEQMGILVPDGDGPRGTNRWMLPFSRGGDKIAPLTKYQGDKSNESLGDIPSGDIPSGDKMTPEFNNLNQDISDYVEWVKVKTELSKDMPRGTFSKWVKDSHAVDIADGVVTVEVVDKDKAEWLESRVKSSAERLLVGIMGRDVQVQFVVR